MNIDIEAFKTTVKNLYESTNIIAATPGQELQDIENPTFTTPTASSTTRSSQEGTPSHSQTLSTKDQMMMDLYSDDAIEEEIADLHHLEDRILQLPRKKKKKQKSLTGGNYIKRNFRVYSKQPRLSYKHQQHQCHLNGSFQRLGILPVLGAQE